MTTPTPRPASWRSVSLRRSAPTPRGAQRSSSPGSETSTPACPGPLPAPRAPSWTARACAAAPSPPPRLPLERALRPRHTPQRRVVDRLQRLVPHRRRDARRSPHRAGRGLSLPHRLPRAGAPHRPGDAARVSARLPGVRPPPGHPDRQRPALRRRRPGAASHPSPHGGSSSGSSPSASSRDTPNRTGVSSASTAPSRRRRRRRPGPTGDGSGEPSTTSGTATTTSDPTRPWDSDRRSGSTPPRSGPIPHASARRNTEPRSPCAECATTARSSGRGTESM